MNRAERRSTNPSRADLQAQAKRRRIVLIASVVVLAAVILIAVVLASRVPPAATEAPNTAQLVVGAQAPPFSVATTSGPFDLTKAGGKPTLLEVFATWCPHCQRETSVLNAVYAAYKDRVNFVAVNGSPLAIDSTTPESQADVIDFATKFQVKYPIAFDPNLDVAHKYLQSGFPTVVLIGADGKVQSIGSGEIPHADIAKALDASVAGKKPAAKLGAAS